MAHFRHRLAQEALKKALKHSPIVGLFGHRQAGKTTLIERLASAYVTLDLRETLQILEQSPMAFLEGNMGSPLAIDESQLSPSLFPALKEFVRRMPRPGQFLLTGSVRYSSRQQIRESLTGRIMNFELTPMGLHELYEKPLGSHWGKIIKTANPLALLEHTPIFTDGDIKKYIIKGGLPGFFAIRDSEVLNRKRESLIETLLERDLRLLIQTTLDFPVLRNFLSILASKQCEALDFSHLARQSGISLPAVKRLLSAFQSMFLIRILPTIGEKHPILLFEDPGEGSYLAPNLRSEVNIIRALFAHLRPLLEFGCKERAEFFQYRTRGQAFVPLAFKANDLNVGFICSSLDGATAKHIASAQSFLKHFPKSLVFIIHQGKQIQQLQKNLVILPIRYVF